MATKESVLRGYRAGSSTASPDDGRYTEPAPRTEHEFRCLSGHVFPLVLSADAEVPAVWDCPSCGEVAGPAAAETAPALRQAAYPSKSHWEQLLGRRSIAELETLLEQALSDLRKNGRAFNLPGR